MRTAFDLDQVQSILGFAEDAYTNLAKLVSPTSSTIANNLLGQATACKQLNNLFMNENYDTVVITEDRINFTKGTPT